MRQPVPVPGADAAAVAAAAAAVTIATVAAPTAAARAAPSADAPARRLKAAFDPEPSWLTLPAPSTPFQADLEADAPTLPGWPLVSWEEQPMPNLGEDVLVKPAVAATPEHAAGSECSLAADPAAQQPLDFCTGFWQVCARVHHG